MSVARIENNEIKEVREELTLQDIPLHKRDQWKTIYDSPPTLISKYSRAIRTGVGFDVENNRPEWYYEIKVENVNELIQREAIRRVDVVVEGSRSLNTMNNLYHHLQRKTTLTSEEQALKDKIEEVQDYIVAVKFVGKNLKEVSAENFEEDGHWPTPPTGLEELFKLIKG